MNKVDNIEKQIVELLSSSICVELERQDTMIHPCVIFEASKSIIGLDIDAPCHVLINFMVDSSRELTDDMKLNNENIESETTSIFELEECLINKNYEKSKNVICKLVNLSDGKNLIEFMLETSMLQSGKSLQVVWSIYKIMSFIGYQHKKDVRNALALSSRAIILDDFQSHTDEYDIDKDEIFNEIELDQSALFSLSQLYEIDNTQFIRHKTIRENAAKYLGYYQEKIIDRNKFSENIKEPSEPFRRKELLNILLKLGINKNNILLINSIRAYMKNCSNINYERVIFYLYKLGS